MKKHFLIAAAVIAATVGLGYAASSMRNLEERSKCESGFKCTVCNGTGWQGNFKCSMCRGTGANSSY